MVLRSIAPSYSSLTFVYYDILLDIVDSSSSQKVEPLIINNLEYTVSNILVLSYIY